MMKKVILFGGTGNLGREIAKELKNQDYDVVCVVRNRTKASFLSELGVLIKEAEVTNKNSLKDICVGFDIVISTLGKSVSLNDKSKTTFEEIDLDANTNILEEAKKSGIKKFVYISALHSENYLHLDYFRVHHEFSERVKASGINYSIIKPPAIMCAFIDVIKMAREGKLMNIGKGDKVTNPIYEGDLAKVAVDAIKKNNAVIEAGGKRSYTRKQLNEIVQNEVKPGKKLISIPLYMIEMGLPLMKLFSKNAYDKFAFYIEVMKTDTNAPEIGDMSFEDYIREKAKTIN
jgi:uncharacterized protein YbjT (DUF2867 family)